MMKSCDGACLFRFPEDFRIKFDPRRSRVELMTEFPKSRARDKSRRRSFVGIGGGGVEINWIVNDLETGEGRKRVFLILGSSDS